MKFSLRSRGQGPGARGQKAVVGAVVLLMGVFALRGELTKWAENVEAGGRLENVFFRNGARRPPKETRPELSKLIVAAPKDGELYSLRALEAEQQLDFAAADADWKKYIDVAADKGAARVALADFYHRRLQSKEEFDALTFAAREFAPDSEKLLPDSQQRPWKLYERMMKLVDEQRLDPILGVTQYWAWIQRFPAASELYRSFFVYAVGHEQYAIAEQVIAAYQKAEPKDEEFPVEARAELASKVGPAAQALAVYEKSFRPLWPSQMVTQYFALLKKTNSLRTYLARSRASLAANPADLTNAARIFYYWQQQGNAPAAERALVELRQRKDARRSAWATEELLTLGRLFESSHNYDEAARNYYALYSAAGSDLATAETALGSLARLLLSAPEQAIHFGSGNLSLYRDVATIDPHPGFLNGILSLLLNSADPADHYALEEQSAAAYFRRSRAAELVALFESRFPNSTARPELRQRVIEAYAIYGSSDGVIRAGAKFLTDFPDAASRPAVAMRMADAYARRNQTQQEFATYDALLKELAQRASGVPLGALVQTQPKAQATPRSPEYARVLDRYIARLVSLKRVRDALSLYRREIDRNPKDPGLYDVLAAFLEQNKLGSEMEQTYQRAIAQFQDHTWEHKLARWYLRQKRHAEVAQLTRDVVKIFSGTELEAYFREIVKQAAPVGPALYLQLNLFAHERFPHQLSFVHNLLTAYTSPQTRNDAAYEVLLRQHWSYDEDLRRRFFERLSRTGRLAAELSAATGRMLAEGEAWRGHFEAAAPAFLALETNFPADRVVGRRTASVYRSLGGLNPKFTTTSIAVEEKLSQADPRDRATLTRLGEMEAEREHFDRAGGYWNRIVETEPSKPDVYLEAASVFWDYYRYDDALRLLDEGRTRLANPSLFAYEEGAIRENQRNYERAILEYAKGAIAQSGSNAEQRLLALARRPALRAQIELLTDNLVSGRNLETGSFNLRVALLRNQNRRDDLEKFLLALASRADAPELLSAIDNTGRVDGYPRVQQAAIERQIAVNTDPVERMRLRLGLARFHEGQGQAAQGAQVIDAVYRENPAILGVVRAAVDYHWRNKNTKRAVDVLEEAARRAETGYRQQFTLEAARKATEAGDYARASGFTAKLLEAEPGRAEYIAAMADTFARQGDDRGLRAFYDAKIRELTAARATEQIAAMRRALIPALTRMKDFSGGVDQYIEILNRYPEDEALAREAALYASSNGVSRKLRDYYTKAVADSPKDYRWPLVLARIETEIEDYPSAIASYTKAAVVRPDRADLLIARLNLEERLLRFDDAAVSAEKLYELTYRNSQWMDKLAELRARQGQTVAAVTALNRAWIEGRSDKAQNFLTVAERLESWGMLAEARKFAEDGLKRARNEGIVTYGRILTRQRDYEAALTSLTSVDSGATARVLQVMGSVVRSYYSPEEKAKFGAALEKKSFRIDLAASAGLADLEAKWRYERLLAKPAAPSATAERQKLVELQRQRLAFDELGGQLEALDRALPAGAQHADELLVAAASYRASGNTAGEMRVLQIQYDRSALDGPLFDRYCQLLLAQPQTLVAAMGREKRSASAYAVLNYAIQHGNATVAQQAIAARGQIAGPLWTNAYTALIGVYYGSRTASVDAAFTGILGDMTIGSRIGKPVDRDRQLAGDLWFYYAGRYGEHRGSADYLPAMVEATPGRSEAYFTLAEFSQDAADYRYALELNPARADVHDRLAVIASKAGRADEAVQEWKLALGAFTQMMNRSRVPQKFWGDLGDMLHHVGEAKALPPLRDDIEKLLRLYIRRNGAFQVDALLEGVLAAGGDVQWIAELSRSAADPVQFLSATIDQRYIPEAQKDILYRKIVESAQSRVAQSFGDQQADAQRQVWTWQISWAKYLHGRREDNRALDVISSLPAEARKQQAFEVVPLEVSIAARTKSVAAQLAKYEEPLPIDQLRNAASELTKEGDAASARRVLELVYGHELKAGNYDMSNFLGLAEIRIEEKNTPGAMALLRRMTLVSGDSFRALDPAAALLEKMGYAAEAAEFLAALVKAEPWNADARGRLAAAQGSMAELTAVAKSANAPYTIRVAAAVALRKLKGPALAGTDLELVLLSGQTAVSEADVSKPYFAAARMEAATVARDAALRERLLAGAIAIDPKPTPPKLALFRAASEARHDALVVAVGRQLLPQYFSEQTEFTSWVADSFLPGLGQGDRAMVASALGEAHQRLGDLRAVLLYLQIAQRIGPAGDAVRRSIETVRAQVEANAKNEARRPVVGDNLDQDRLVRLRLVAR